MNFHKDLLISTYIPPTYSTVSNVTPNLMRKSKTKSINSAATLFHSAGIRNSVPEKEKGRYRQYSLFDFNYTNTSGGRFKNTYELLNLRALKFSPVNKIFIFQCMGKIFCVEFQRYPLKFHTKYHTHTLKDMIFIQHWNFKSSYI